MAAPVSYLSDVELEIVPLKWSVGLQRRSLRSWMTAARILFSSRLLEAESEHASSETP
jgi:hypothetical protein